MRLHPGLAALGWLMALVASAAGDDRLSSTIAKSQGAIGQSLPDLALTGADGGTIALERFRGKPLLVSLV